MEKLTALSQSLNLCAVQGGAEQWSEAYMEVR
jgi:hypothetical protein